MSLLLTRDYYINPYISVKVPTVGEVMENENGYFNAVTAITATPYDMMLELEDAGIPFDKISEWDLFLMNFESLKETDTHLIFGDLDLRGFKPATHVKSGEQVLWDSKKNLVIDTVIYEDICEVLCKILAMERKNKKPANKDAKEYMLEKARKKRKRMLREYKKNKFHGSFLDPVILSLVCTPEFPYDFETIKNITIYQLLVGLKQTQTRVDYNAYSYGCMAGFADMSKIDPNKFAWIKDKI